MRRRSAFGLLQETLNAQSDALWGLATNGVLLRIARDNASLTRPAWVEVDLERLFIEERFADFSVLWLLLHASRFGGEGGAATDCALEQWRSSCREQGTRAREALRLGVEQALLVLGQGFVSHPANVSLRQALSTGALDASGYFKELLRLVYRQIFLLTIEEREVLHPLDADSSAAALYAQGYGLRRLRDRAVRRSAHDRHDDLWQGLRQVWHGLAAGQPLLGLPALGGLFAPHQCPTLDGARLENRHLLLAMFHLAWMRERPGAPLVRVNWRDMGPEELGSIYESLLELAPQLTDEHRTFGFQSGAGSRGNARKTSASHYTHDTLVQLLLDEALEPLIARALAAHPSGQPAVDALLAITVADPACGSGHFLLGAARRIAKHLARVTAEMNGNGQPSPAYTRCRRPRSWPWRRRSSPGPVSSCLSRRDMSLRTLGMLDRAGLRKIATDCGFDVLEDGADWVEAASTQAPLRAWVGLSMDGPVLGLSMLPVLTELPAMPMVVPAAAEVSAAGWIQLADLGSLDRTLLRAWRLSRALPNQLEVRHTELLATLSATEREATVRQRIGQDLFRDGLLTLWRGRCAISGLNVPELLRASHAKPWAESTDAERLDVYNGLLLAAHLDAAFDCGLITVEVDGTIATSSTLPAEATTLLRLNAGARVTLSLRHGPYLAWHRERVFRR